MGVERAWKGSSKLGRNKSWTDVFAVSDELGHACEQVSVHQEENHGMDYFIVTDEAFGTALGGRDITTYLISACGVNRLV